MTETQKVKRFYGSVSVQVQESGFGICLDERLLQTQNKIPLIAPTQELAEAIAKEWDDQVDYIDRQTMKLNALMSGAIDGEKNNEVTLWVEDTLKYLRSDLLCYRVNSPSRLAARQNEIWQPYLDWLQQKFDAPLIVTQTLRATEQPTASIDTVGAALRAMSAPALFSVKTATAMTGSAVLGVALWKDAFALEDIFNASLVDEHFQQERWGVDEEAHQREAAMRAEFMKVAEFLRLL